LNIKNTGYFYSVNCALVMGGRGAERF